MICKIAATTSVLAFGLLFTNILLGVFDRDVFLKDVGEATVLFSATILFAIAIIAAESKLKKPERQRS